MPETEKIDRTKIPKGEKIAVVEDTPEILLLYGKIIPRLGYPQPELFENGTSILKSLVSDREKYDIILMDYRLPEMDGIEVSEAILRYRPKTRIIIVSAYDFVEGRAASLGLQFLRKPFTLEELHSTLSNSLKCFDSI
jgi:CheY-like chemotaxis protein